MSENFKFIKLTCSYDGSKFLGSQTQPHKLSVEDNLNLALSRVGIFTKVKSSSRTDKGVHALNQISITKCLSFWDLNRLKELINSKICDGIYIKNIEEIDENFNPRFDAKFRVYRYILNHNEVSVFAQNYSHYCKSLDINRLNLALNKFQGQNDFKNFYKTGSDEKSTIREIYKAFAYRYKNLTIIKFVGNSFLRSQVRLMVANSLKFAYENKNFELNNPNTRIPAPANGLYLVRIGY